MTLNIIPTTMRARHHETGEWHTLNRGDDAYFTHGLPASQCYSIQTCDEPIWADLYDFDCFEGVVQ